MLRGSQNVQRSKRKYKDRDTLPGAINTNKVTGTKMLCTQ